MKRSAWSCIVLALFLVGCDLEEAERMDLTRSGVKSIEPEFGGVRFRGSSTIPLRQLLEAFQKGSAGIGWSFEWKDAGTRQADTLLLCVQARLDDEIVFEANGPNWWNAFCLHMLESEWLNESERITFRLFEIDRAYGTRTPLPYDPGLRIVDDRPKLEIDASSDARPIVRKGDTVAIAVRNPNPDSLRVFDDHAGLRTVGDYLTTLAPGASATLRWVVTANPGTPVWIDLGWGEWGGARRFEYRLEEP